MEKCSPRAQRRTFSICDLPPRSIYWPIDSSEGLCTLCLLQLYSTCSPLTPLLPSLIYPGMVLAWLTAWLEDRAIEPSPQATAARSTCWLRSSSRQTAPAKFCYRILLTFSLRKTTGKTGGSYLQKESYTVQKYLMVCVCVCFQMGPS